VVEVERRVGLRVIDALVRAAALLACERAARDLAGEREWVVLGEASELVGVAAQAGALPQRGARRTWGHGVRAPRGRRAVVVRRRFAVERGQGGAAAEDEAFGE
jgi:hypothetical protein